MGKFKYYFCIILWTFMPKMGLAQDLELSDIIREARENQMQVAKSQIEQTLSKTKEQYAKAEQSAEEKLIPEKILNQDETK